LTRLLAPVPSSKKFAHMGYVKDARFAPDSVVLADYAVLVLHGEKVSGKRHHPAAKLYVPVVQSCFLVHGFLSPVFLGGEAL
jgi:hypothetical protein